MIKVLAGLATGFSLIVACGVGDQSPSTTATGTRQSTQTDTTREAVDTATGTGTSTVITGGAPGTSSATGTVTATQSGTGTLAAMAVLQPQGTFHPGILASADLGAFCSDAAKDLRIGVFRNPPAARDGHQYYDYHHFVCIDGRYIHTYTSANDDPRLVTAIGSVGRRTSGNRAAVTRPATLPTASLPRNSCRA